MLESLFFFLIQFLFLLVPRVAPVTGMLAGYPEGITAIGRLFLYLFLKISGTPVNGSVNYMKN